MKYFNINNYKIGVDQPVFIIAEIGVNHNGDVALAIKMIEEAARCGANCVKFQTFKAERVVLKEAPKAEYQLKVTDTKESQIEMLKGLELPFDAYKKIIECCKKEGVIFMSTPYNVEDVDFLEELETPAYKLASIHAAEPWFSGYVASKGKPVILSTGMATIEEVEKTVNAIRNTHNNDLVLLQCTTNYPSRLEDVNLRAMLTMSEAFGLQVGYSDHTQNDISSIVAVSIGATVIEKHFTTDKSLSGPDQTTSANPEEFAKLVQSIRCAEMVLGSSIKEPSEMEKKNAPGMRRSIVAKCNISAGTKITEAMLTFKRPYSGISPLEMDKLLGQYAKVDIQADALIQFSDIQD